MVQVWHPHLGGSSGKFPFEARPQYSYMVFLCGPDVATVRIQRSDGIRTADVNVGPGWLAVLWTPAASPSHGNCFWFRMNGDLHLDLAAFGQLTALGNLWRVSPTAGYAGTPRVPRCDEFLGNLGGDVCHRLLGGAQSGSLAE